MLPPEAVLFDLDGTLIDSRGDIVAAMNHALEARGWKAQPAPSIIRYVGDGARALCARVTQLDESAPEVDALVESFIDYYLAHPVDFTRWMPGAQEALDLLAGIGVLLGICTNKPRTTTDAVLSALGIRTRFRAVNAGGDLLEKKPAPAPLLHVVKQMGVTPETTVMVGDGPQDIEAARRAGMRGIAVEHGFASRERLMAAQPDILLTDLHGLPDVIRRWRETTARFPTQIP